MQVTRGNLLLKQVAITQTASGLVLPETAHDKTKKGEIVQVGSSELTPDGKEVKHSFEKGQTVVFKNYTQNEIVIDGQEYWVVEMANVLVIL